MKKLLWYVFLSLQSFTALASNRSIPLIAQEHQEKSTSRAEAQNAPQCIIIKKCHKICHPMWGCDQVCTETTQCSH